MSRFQDSGSISSDDFFERNLNRGASNSAVSGLANVNLYDIKEGVRDGVTAVAGKLSNLATNLVSSVKVSIMR